VNFVEFDGMGGSIAITHNWNRLCCAWIVDGEGVAEEMLCLTDIINEVCNHACCFDERKTKD
jgi:hypothetical protein